MHDRQALATRAVRAGIDCDRSHRCGDPAGPLSANFSFDGLDGKRRYDYTRSGNPTRDVLGGALAELEGGAGAVVTATGMAAVGARAARAARARRTAAGPARLLRRQLAPVQRACRQGRCSSSKSCDFTDAAQLGAAFARRPQAGLDRNAVEPAAAHHRPRSGDRGGARGRCPGSGRQHLPLAGSCSGRSSSAPTSSSTRPRNISTATATSSAARRSHATLPCSTSSPGGPMRSASPARRSTAT